MWQSHVPGGTASFGISIDIDTSGDSAPPHAGEARGELRVDSALGNPALDKCRNLRDGFERLVLGGLRRQAADVRRRDDLWMPGKPQ
jgi:hypothetical protein